MTPFQAAILMGQIRRLEAQSTLRDENSAYLEKLLGEIKGVGQLKNTRDKHDVHITNMD